MKLLQSQISWWIALLTVVVSVITFFVGLNFRVQALETDNLTFKDFIRIHTEQQATENSTLTEMNTKLKLVTDYFKLTPKE